METCVALHDTYKYALLSRSNVGLVNMRSEAIEQTDRKALVTSSGAMKIMGLALFCIGLIILGLTLLQYTPSTPSPAMDMTECAYIKDECEWFKYMHLPKLSEFNPEIREVAMNILHMYRRPLEIVAKSSHYYLSMGDVHTESVHLPVGVNVTVDVTVSGFENIVIKVINPDGKLIASDITGRFLYRFTTDIDGSYIILLRNPYNSGKSVYLSVKFYMDIDIDDPIYKVMAIGYWVGLNIRYVSDPRGLEYIAPPVETIRVKAGDCDDFAVLLAALYESVGLDAVIGFIDTDNDGGSDHLTAIVYLDLDSKDALDLMEEYEQIFGISVRKMSYFTRIQSTTGGTWLIVDPPMAMVKYKPWEIDQEPYTLLCYVDFYFSKQA